MGQDISKSLNPPPLTLQDCLVNGKFDLTQYVYYRRKIDMINDDLSSHSLPKKGNLIMKLRWRSLRSRVQLKGINCW